MQRILTSQVTQLVYLDAPNLNFAHLVGDFSKTFVAPGDPAPQLSWDCDDIALLDFNAARVVIGYSEALPGPHAACLTLAIGQSPLAGKAALSANDLAAFCGVATEFLTGRFPADGQHIKTLDQALTADLIDSLVDALFDPLNGEKAALVKVAAPEVAIASTPTPALADMGEMDQLLDRFSSELVNRAPNMITQAITAAAPPENKVAPPKQAAGLFWRKKIKAAAADGAEKQTQSAPSRRPTADELQAVRKALYSSDGARGGAAKAFSGPTRLAFQTLADLTATLSGKVRDRRRNGGQPGQKPDKH